MVSYDNVGLAPYNTFAIEASAKKMIDCFSMDDVAKAVATIGTAKCYVLGGGSNTLFTSDFDGIIIRPLIDGIDVIDVTNEDVYVRVGAGVEWDSFTDWACRNYIFGTENLSGIPGNVGASPVQNIGAYGAEVKDIIYEVEGIRIDNGQTFKFHAENCNFGYRNSIFKNKQKGKCIITHVTYHLSLHEHYNLEYGTLRSAVEALGETSISNVREAVIGIRNSKLPDPKETGNAGSFFKNPEIPQSIASDLQKEFPSMPIYDMPNGQKKISAGWLIEKTGWKGRTLGRAAVHDRQALVLVNKGGATGQEIIDLCNAVRADVKAQFGIDLLPEVNFVP